MQTELAQTVVNLHKLDTCPTADVVSISENSSWIIWIMSYVKVPAQTEGMTLSDLANTLKSIKTWESIDIQFAISKYKLSGLLEGSKIQTQSRSVLCDGQLEKLNEFAESEAIKNTFISSIYESLKEIAERWCSCTLGSFAVRKLGCLLAANILTTTKKATVFQLDTGNGKTYIHLLVCEYLLKHTHIKPVYVTLNPILKRQTTKTAQKFEIADLIVIDYDELD